ncbi:glycoside hydrolase family 9 protein [Pseudobacteroides cellulosolvens]|uniref:Cellulose 1,4-beta-cellobiosidase n=1 Tax=Pseudobacteroides cellulosolvens ATCC 35603 = DSM 2933 TaxID=398512 RepID=A0A0L6JR75_9FIRM|nr:glycoside hydrolase family 9 protein [Pseudobacteroides cellulosolvens]KNY28341.1 Cellulose 1,4-beta-cellobiosidase [Pseudobacteroides cellulosolvens ATCC 35603 = DSM 2933]
MKKKLAVIGTSLLALAAGGVTCSAAEMLQTTDFKGGVILPWKIAESNEQNSWQEVKDGKYVVHMEQKGTNKWDVQLRHREISIKEGHKYTVKFSVTSNKATKIYAKIGDMGDPYGEVWNNKWQPYSLKAGEILDVEDTFTADKNYELAEYAFHLGGELTGLLPVDISFISMSLDDPDFVPTPNPTPTPFRDIRVNQLGYFPNSIKKATFKVPVGANTAVWNLKNIEGIVVASGKSIPLGIDHASGDYVHIIDFSNFTTPGRGYILSSGNAESLPFDIGTDMYSQMKNDALKYFYHARSGIEIKMPYCANSKWARPVGHPNDKAALITGRNYIGPETINGTGGWYDSADHGKYVVNGGLALWVLQNQYEYSKAKGIENAFDDGKLNIPESGNNTNDLLDETRWEMEWMLKMQIPEGFDRSGMAVHKLAGENWTRLGTRPDQDTEKRIYYPPSTAATLNLAACAAQAARLWKDIDSDFSQRCLTASKLAYKAAKENPSIFAPYGQEPGSNTYGDNYVDDDFYWAACELYVTTGEAGYLNDLNAYNDSEKMPVVLTGEYNGIQGCFDRCATGGLGTLTLALHKLSEFPNVKEGIKNAADTFINIQNKEGYGIPFAETSYINEFAGQREMVTGYPYGSNAYVVNEALVMAYAYDLSEDVKYINGLTESMDYLMGRNPLFQVYVSGYGENPVKYPHHRFFCPQIDIIYPSAPPGFLVGGPNSGAYYDMQGGCSPNTNVAKTPSQKYYHDHVEAWGTNEVMISWNASLAWVTNYLDAFGRQIPMQPVNTPTLEVVVEDINKDGVVNISDIVIIAIAFGTTPDCKDYNALADLNQDGAINMVDVVAIARKFGYAYSLK